jgi:methionyl-tRNA formyltransferase
MKPLEFIILGTSQFTLICTQILLDLGVEVQAMVCLPLGQRQLDSVDIEAFARRHGLDYLEFNDLGDPFAIAQLKSYQPDYIFSSWPHLLKAETLQIPAQFVIGSHPTALPYNRGRHPLYWLISLGFTESKISFFIMDEKVDNGAILAQIPFALPKDQDISTAVHNMGVAAQQGMAQVVANLRDPAFKLVPQDAAQANVWRKRSPHDIILDPRMSADMAIRLVRSFAPPYPAAILIWKEHLLRVAKAQIDDGGLSAEALQRLEQGRVCEANEKTLRLKFDDHILKLECVDQLPAAMQTARYVQPPTYYFMAHAAVLTTQFS